ncbi:MAG TPA: type IX secretion system sortase PorU [bacterium]
MRTRCIDHKANFIVFIVIFLLAFQNFLFGNQQLQVLESSDRGVTIAFTPRIEKIDTLQLKNEKYYKIYMTHTVFTGNPGEPIIPLKPIHVGIPLESDVNVTVVSVETEEFSGKLQPAPVINSQTGVYTYEPDPLVYQTVEFFPQQIFSTEPAGFIRDQRVVTIGLRTLQYSGALDRIRLYKKIVLRVDFTGNPGKFDNRTIAKEDNEFYDGIVVNYSQSKRWLKQHQRSLARVASAYQSDNWFKIITRQEGMHKITGTSLSAAGITIASINTNSIRVYNNGGQELPRDISAARPDTLIENAIRIVDLNNNGKLDSDDYILFYGRPVNYWEQLDGSEKFYKHYVNHYTNENVYWLTWDNTTNGKRMARKISTPLPEIDPAEDFVGLHFHEDEINIPLKSGLSWFGRLMAGSSEQRYSVYLPNSNNVENNVLFRFQSLGLSYGLHRFTLYLNNQFLSSFSFSGQRLESHQVEKTISLSPDGYNSLRIVYNGDTAESQAYIDWFEIQHKKKFIAENNYLRFNRIGSEPHKFTLTNFQNSPIEIYDVTDYKNVQLIQNTTISSGSVSFSDTTIGANRFEYIALTPAAYVTPERIERATLANLRTSIAGADFIIITHEDFYQSMLQLQSHREIHDSLTTAVVKISDIFNEFSWGLYDPTAIRDFIKYAFDNWIPAPKYVLLCGDGDYDYKNIDSNLDKNWIPPFQTTEISENVNRTMDEWYVLVSGRDEKPDLSIGRFPVQTAEEASNVVEKIIEYETASFLLSNSDVPLDEWRNIVTMVGDDEKSGGDSDNETIHTRDAEYIIENYVPNSFNKEKIYLIEYPEIEDPSTSGIMKPAATEALLDRIHKGTLILNYIGHGAPSLWAHERLLKESRDFDLINNNGKLPLWVAATCDFGRFDDPKEQSFAERLFAAKNRGGIAFLTSARLAYATDNTSLNREFFYQLLFTGAKPTERLGVALTRAKINNYSTTNDQKYHLFGDPTMRLVAPKYSAKVTSLSPDTLTALSEVTIKGQAWKDQNIWSDFNGKALLKIFDSSNDKVYRTKYGSEIRYRAAGRTLFRGALAIKAGQFEAKFIVPKDITYGGTSGRISLYFADQEAQGIGYQDLIPVGGTSVLQDDEGPIIKFGFDGRDVATGDYIGEKSLLEVEIADSISGINIAGDIGHNITMVIDDKEDEKILLTDYFNYFEGNFKAGKVRFDLSNYKTSVYDEKNNLITQYGLSQGGHAITIKAWDNFNNSSVVTENFTVVGDGVLKLKDVLNFPNPFSSSTNFTFVVNQPCQVNIKIYTVAGRLIETLQGLNAVGGANHFYWDGSDRDGNALANGIYLYKIIASATQDNKSSKDEFIGKLVIAK